MKVNKGILLRCHRCKQFDGALLGSLLRQRTIMMGEGIQGGVGRYPAETGALFEADMGDHSWTNAEPNTRMKQALERPNLMRAYQRVVSNKGVAGNSPEGSPARALANAARAAVGRRLRPSAGKSGEHA
jgi:hypothetical protein